MSSGAPRREERVERAEADEGDPEETVYVKGNGISGGSKCYHRDPACSRLKCDPDEVEETTREAAQRRWKSPCQWCCDEEPENTN